MSIKRYDQMTQAEKNRLVKLYDYIMSDDFSEPESCYYCFGRGFVITCPDDMCANNDHCIHGDGEMICPICKGEGEI